MVGRLLAGEKARAVARSMGCSPTTVTTARDRWLEASEAERASGAWCVPRRPVPGSCPWRLDPESERKILEARERTNWGEMRLQFLCGRHRSTIGRVLRRNGCSERRRSEARQTTRRYEWSQPGALLHIDGFELPKFDRPGHWADGDRRDRSRQVGKTVVIGIVDDHTRLAYCELHSQENASAVSATLRRAAAWFSEQGCGPLQAVMSDNAKCYATSFAFRDTLAELGARQIPDPALHTTLERQNRTLLRNTRHRMGARPGLAQLDRPRPRPVIVPAPLQPQAPTLSRRAADHPPAASTKSASRTTRRASGSRTRGLAPASSRAAQDEAGDQEHDHDADDGADDAAEVERVVVADTEAAREDQVADQGADQTEHDRDPPRLRARHVGKGIVRDECPPDESCDQTEDQRTDHPSPPIV
jgi:hypothetical protein